MSNITQVVNVDKNMTTLKKGMHAAGLDQVLSSTGPFTFFAPSDAAFKKLDSGMMEDLLKPENKLQLTQLLRQHVVSGKINLKDFKEGDNLTTIDGTELPVSVIDGMVTIGGAAVGNRQVTGSNGIVHSLDTVLNN